MTALKLLFSLISTFHMTQVFFFAAFEPCSAIYSKLLPNGETGSYSRAQCLDPSVAERDGGPEQWAILTPPSCALLCGLIPTTSASPRGQIPDMPLHLPLARGPRAPSWCRLHVRGTNNTLPPPHASHSAHFFSIKRICAWGHQKLEGLSWLRTLMCMRGT